MDQDSTRLAPPAVNSLRVDASGTAMARTLSEGIREEREDLREAVEQTLNVIVDLNLDGSIRWVSPSWGDVVGTSPDTVMGMPIADLIVSDNKTVFAEAIESMKQDDSRSHFIRFALCLASPSKLLPDYPVTEGQDQEPVQVAVELEAQGIMIYNRATGGESHTMWMVRPWMAPRQIKIDLPSVIVDSLGSGAEILASYLTRLAECASDDPADHPPPLPVLCRICERQIPPWWFEKHTDLCLQEHRAEMDVQMAQENLVEHRHFIVKVLDALEVRKSRPLVGESFSLPVAEYKGLPIGPTSSSSSPGTCSPAGTSRDRSGGIGHSRTRSFAVRRPQVRIVELLLDLCDTALEISTPAIKETRSQGSGELRTQSPQSESRISQVLQWQSPGANTLEQEQGLALLCADSEKVAKEKVEAVFRYRRILEYSERIRVEFTMIVQDCIDEAMHKAARIAAGRLSDSTDEGDTEHEEDETLAAGREPEPGLGQRRDAAEEAMVEEAMVQETVPEEAAVEEAAEEATLTGSFDTSLAIALKDVERGGGPARQRPSSVMGSTGSRSPRECPTPKSFRGGLVAAGHSRDSRRGSLLLDGEAGGDSEGSVRSSSAASRSRTDSPMTECADLRRVASSRRHQRHSLVIPSGLSLSRPESPSRVALPSSPLHLQKSRNVPFSPSPGSSPVFQHGDFGVVPPVAHHRRQSSAATSDFPVRHPPSPHLTAASTAPLARAVAPSIKDFEIIKPISKGAFGSVYLSKKKSTGEYFAIKVLKKADMVAKNQVTNVKAERAIMMWQGESEFVAKLYWTFSSKDYLYLVMEYLNGGDCASLIKVLGGLPEDWVKKYLGEVILGVEHLHERGIIHRDLKPDNLLIDQRGHLKLTDFGLSRMGLIGRQKRALNSDGSEQTPDLLKSGPFARSVSMASSGSASVDLFGDRYSPGATPQVTPETVGGQPSYFSLAAAPQECRRVSGLGTDSSGTEALTHMMNQYSLSEAHHEAERSPDLAAGAHANDVHPSMKPKQSMLPPPMALFHPEDTNRRFVGTPDYLAPETIKGERQDATSDWWSVGCIMFEFLYGLPPFHAAEAEQVFDKILKRQITWPEDSEFEVSAEAKALMDKLLCTDPPQRLGANREDKYGSGGEEIRKHSWFEGINWDKLLQDEAQFVPQPENPEDTEYFDARGATLQAFAEEMEDQLSPPAVPTPDYADRPHDALSRVRSQVQVNQVKRGLMPLHIPPHIRDLKSRRLSEPAAADDFGSFAFKNLTVLEKANKDVIQQLKAQAAQNRSGVSPVGVNPAPSPAPSMDSPQSANPLQRTVSNAKASHRPVSPANTANASPSRPSQPASPLLISFVAGQEGRRKPSSTSSSLSQQSSLSAGCFLEAPRVAASLSKAASSVATASPIKSRGPPLPMALACPQKQPVVLVARQPSSSSTRSRSLTVGSQDGSPTASEILTHQRNRRSQVFDMSPSSSDNEGDKAHALLRVRRRRQSSRRLSSIVLDSPSFRSLVVLICEDHPVSRMVMEKLLEKLRCRTISASTGSEAVRYAMSDISFDIIFTEFKLPEVSGVDLARMVRELKNVNAHTPIVAITAYLKELQAPHYFDSLVEKPISSSKLVEVLSNLCQWKPPSPGQAAVKPLSQSMVPVPRSGLRQESLPTDDSPSSGSSGDAQPTGRSSFRASSRENSVSSSMFADPDTPATDDALLISRKGAADWEEAGLGIVSGSSSPKTCPPMPSNSAQVHMESSARLAGPRPSWEKAKFKRDKTEKKHVQMEGSDSVEEDDEEQGARRDRALRAGKSMLPSSKLGIEMMRANSHDSIFVSDSTVDANPQPAGATSPAQTVHPHARPQSQSPLSGSFLPETLLDPSVNQSADDGVPRFAAGDAEQSAAP